MKLNKRWLNLRVCLLSSGFVKDGMIRYHVNNKIKLIDKINPDIYFHTYQNEFVDVAKSLYNFKKIEIEKEVDLPKYEKPVSVTNNRHRDTKFENVMHMWRKRKLSFDMINDKYDVYVYSRLDIGMYDEFPIDALGGISNNTILIPDGGDYEGGYNDLMAVGNHESMKVYMSMIDNMLDYSKEGCMFHPEVLLRYHLNKKNMNVKRFTMKLWVNNWFYN